MKKRIGKIVLISLVSIVLLFLLLPFIAPDADTPQGTKKATPQIFTSNPLTALVNRIAAVFQGKQKRLERKAALAQAQANAANAKLNELYASAKNAPTAARYSAAEAQPADASTNPRFDASAPIQDEDGNWVLVRQTAPEGAGRGMHEINSDDDAYERYVRQESAARYTPALGTAYGESEKSSFARVFAPIKNFFGFGKTASAQAELGPDALALAQGEGLGSSSGKSASSSTRPSTQLPRITPNGLSARTSGGAARGGGEYTGPFTSAAEMFDPMVAISRAADWSLKNLDDSATAEERESMQEKLKAFREEKRAELAAMLDKQMLEAAGNAPATDRVPSTIGCQGESNSLYNDSNKVCSISPSISQDPSAWQNAEALEKSKQAGRQQMIEKLHLQDLTDKIPEINVLVVLGKTNQLLPPDAQTPDNATTSSDMREAYNAMLEAQGCNKGDCYWIPNRIQQYPNVRQAVTAAGVNAVEDPLDIYQKIAKEALDHFEQKLDNSDESTLRFMELQRNLSEKAPAYIPITRAQLDELNARNDDKNMLNPQTRNNNVIFYVPDPQNARDIKDAFQENPAFFVWGKDGSAFERGNDLTDEQRGQIVQEDLTERIQQMGAFARSVEQELRQRNIADSARRAAEKTAGKSTQDLNKALNNINRSAAQKNASKNAPRRTAAKKSTSSVQKPVASAKKASPSSKKPLPISTKKKTGTRK